MEAWEVACVLLLMEAWVLLSILPINQHLNLKHQLINHTMYLTLELRYYSIYTCFLIAFAVKSLILYAYIHD
jgi:hypothetical protein